MDRQRVSGRRNILILIARPWLLMHQLKGGKNEALTVRIEKAFTDVIGNDAQRH